MFLASVFILFPLIVSACDQCRKSKCKCERSGADELCKSCAMLGTRESNNPSVSI